tara:strand:- start:116 stop:298 length:183 start_codon:yes stop_codon:yes gene_type:complete
LSSRKSIGDPDHDSASKKAKDEALHFESLQDKEDSDEHPDLGMDDSLQADLDNFKKNSQK